MAAASSNPSEEVTLHDTCSPETQAWIDSFEAKFTDTVSSFLERPHGPVFNHSELNDEGSSSSDSSGWIEPAKDFNDKDGSKYETKPVKSKPPDATTYRQDAFDAVDFGTSQGAAPSGMPGLITWFRLATLGLDDYTSFIYSDPSTPSMTLIGEGTNYVVYRRPKPARPRSSRLRETPDVLAVKRLKAHIRVGGDVEPDFSEQRRLLSMLREISTMRSLRAHEEVVDMLGFGRDIASDRSIHHGQNYSPFLVVEFAPHGSLSAFLSIKMMGDTMAPLEVRRHVTEAYESVDYGTRLDLIEDTANGIRFLHEHRIFHTDIKPDNVLVFPTAEAGYRAKVADFGAALVTLDHAGGGGGPRFPYGRDFGGTRRYEAPELDLDAELAGLEAARARIMTYSDQQLRKVDTYSFGVLLYECVTSTYCTPAWVSRGRPISELTAAVQDHIPVGLWIQHPVQALSVPVALGTCLCWPDRRADSMESVLNVLKLRVRPLMRCCRPTESDKSKPVNVFTDPQAHNFVSNLDVKRLLEDDIEKLVIMLGNSAAVDWAHQVNLLRDLEAEKAPASCNSLRLGRVIFLLGLARFHGFGTSIQIDRGLEMILEAAVLGFLPARCVYRRLYDAVSSLRRFADDEIFATPATAQRDAIFDVDRDLFLELDRVEQESSGDYLAKVIPLTEHRRWRSTLWQWLLDSPVVSEDDQRPPPDAATARDSTILRTYLLEAARRYRLRNRRDQKPDVDRGLLMGMAIVLDDPDAPPFLSEMYEIFETVADVRINTTMPPSGPSLTSLLSLASRLGNARAARFLLERGADPSIRSESGVLPLHYLFAFPDGDIEQMCDLLSATLDPSDPCVADPAEFILEHLTSLEGSPFAFAVATGNVAAARALWRFDGMRDSLQSLVPTTAQTLASLATVAPQLQAHSNSPALAPSPIAPLLQALATPNPTMYENVLELAGADLGGMVGRGWPWRLLPTGQAGLVFFGIALQARVTRMENLIAAAGDFADLVHVQAIRTIRLMQSLYGSVLVPLDTMYDSLFYVAGWAAAVEATVNPLLVEAIKQYTMSFAVRSYRNYLRRSTLLGFIMGRYQARGDIADAMVVAHLCDDLPSAERLARAAARNRIQWTTVPCMEYFYRELVWAPSPRSTEFAIAISRYERTTWLTRLLGLADRVWLRFAEQHSWGPIAVALSLQDAEALCGWIREGDVSTRSFPFQANVLHLACSNDRFAGVLARLLHTLDRSLVSTLLREETSVGGLTPAAMALHSGSSQCLLALFAYEDATAESGLVTETISTGLDCETNLMRGVGLLSHVSFFLGFKIHDPNPRRAGEEARSALIWHARMLTLRQIAKSRSLSEGQIGELAQWEWEMREEAAIESVEAINNAVTLDNIQHSAFSPHRSVRVVCLAVSVGRKADPAAWVSMRGAVKIVFFMAALGGIGITATRSHRAVEALFRTATGLFKG